MEQFALPNPIVAAQNERCSRRRLVAASAPHQGNEQLSLSLRSSRRPRRQRPCNPNAAVHALALAHLDLADKIAGNFARRTSHPFDDLRQIAVIGLLKAAARFDGTGGRSFRPYARTYANGEITHYLRDYGFAIKVPPSWWDTFASGQKLLREGCSPAELPERLGVTPERWGEISAACTVRVVALPLES